MAKYLRISDFTKEQKDGLFEVLRAAGIKGSVYSRTDKYLDILAIYGHSSINPTFDTLRGNINLYTSNSHPEITLQDFFNEYAPSWANSLQVLFGMYYWVDKNDMEYSTLEQPVKCGMQGTFDKVLFEFISKDSLEETPERFNEAHSETHLFEIIASDNLGIYTTVHDALGNQVDQVTKVRVYKDYLEVTAWNKAKNGIFLQERAHQDTSASTFKLYGGYIKIETGVDHDHN